MIDPEQKNKIAAVFARVSRDSHFKMDVQMVTYLTADILYITKLDVWLALGYDVMERLADSTHPQYLLPAEDGQGATPIKEN